VAGRVGWEENKDEMIYLRESHTTAVYPCLPLLPKGGATLARPNFAMCIHVTHSHAEHMRESIWNKHWMFEWGWVRRKSRGYKRRYTGGESSRSSMRVGVDSDLATTAHPPHTE
jgi:hypothetical protein